MAYRLIVVEDERIMRDGLADIVNWESMGFEVIAKLEDGQDAIEYIQKNPVDVVLTDIKMKFVSGIGLARYIYEQNIPCRIVFISGYQEFELARQAIIYNVVNYLLKPPKFKDIEKVFIEVRWQLDEENKEKQFKEVSKEVYNLSKTSGVNVIDRAKQYIADNFSKDITLEDIAEHIYLNPVYFSRLFKEETGENYINYLIKFRMEKAKELLRDSRYKVNEISCMIGYESVRYFYKLFKRYFGLTPTEYRKKIEEQIYRK